MTSKRSYGNGIGMKRPVLNKLNAKCVVLFEPRTLTFTMSVGQWDNLLQAAYDKGAMLIELDDNENPVAFYRKPKLDTN